MKLGALDGRRVAVWGLGREGTGIARVLADRAGALVLVDDRPAVAALAAEELGPSTPAQALSPASLAGAGIDVIVRSPGVSRYRPELLAAEASGSAVTTPMALWLEEVAGSPVLAVTGTKGKSTTAALAAAILREAGNSVALVGNIGVPVTDLSGRTPPDAYVVEVSSYQAADVTVTPKVCVLTSLAPDHLDWHGGVERYYADKLRLVEVGPPGRLAVSAASDEAVRRTAGHPDRVLFGPSGRIRVVATGELEVDGRPLVDVARLRVPGRHNWWNLCGAIAGILLLEGTPPSAEAVGAAIDGFEGLPSRCATVGTREGVVFVDDALASNPFATAASVTAFAGRDLTVIVGGADRGVAPDELVGALVAHRPPAAVVVLPPDPERLADAVRSALGGPGSAGSGVRVEEAENLPDAVRARATIDPVGGVVLFSPGAPTPEGEGGYAARSSRFREAAGFAEAGADQRTSRA